MHCFLINGLDRYSGFSSHIGISTESAMCLHIFLDYRVPNQTVQRTVACRVAQRLMEHHRRMAPIDYLCVRRKNEIQAHHNLDRDSRFGVRGRIFTEIPA